MVKNSIQVQHKAFRSFELTEPHKNSFHTADTDFQEVVAVSLLQLLNIKAANTLIMD